MIEKEEWKKIPGHKDYLISNKGRVKSMKQGLWGKIRRIQYRTANELPYIIISENNKREGISIHRMEYELFVGFPAEPNRCYIYFKDNDTHNLDLDNLACEVLDVTEDYTGDGKMGIRKSSITRQRMRDTWAMDPEEKKQQRYAYHREYYRKYYEKNKEELKVKAKEYYRTHKKRFEEYYEDRKDYRQRYKESHKEQLNAYHRRYYQENRERILAAMKERYWRKKENDRTQG